MCRAKVALGTAACWAVYSQSCPGGEGQPEDINGLVAGGGDVHGTIGLHTSERIRYLG